MEELRNHQHKNIALEVLKKLLNEEIKSILRTGELLLEVNLGATAIGTRLNTPDGYQQLAVQKLAEVSGLPVIPAEDLIEATSDCGAYVIQQ